MTMNTGQFNNLYTRKIDMAFFEGWDEEPEQWSRIFNSKTGDSHNNTTQILAGMSRWTSKAELANADQQRFKQGPLIVTNYEPFAVEVIMSREQIDDAKYNEVQDMAKDAGHGGREAVEQECASFLQDLYDSTFYDGKAAFANDHPNHGDGGGTQDNLTTGALSDTTLKDAIILFRKQEDEGGKKISSRPSKLVVPQSLQFTAASILQSALQTGTANNDKNVLPNLELVVSDFWDQYTTVRWFICGNRHQLNHIWRVQPEFKKRQYMNPNGSQSWDGYFRHANEITNWRHLVGSTGV
ncbi:Mu-like prophage major head subunit gpT family protein [Paenibacillus alkalitolerans]|uniref:Mu-like prophage major head subunit gpT family protein n=1 Tax=Paenibacillus alkalitolerans TaxID=2799335 RepID=UPI0018F4245B|nr:Mu-like prophage major head subunit gpT family protein [Paenibacillus alkalitolerans]